MADLYLGGHGDLAATTLTDIYTCPTSRSANISVIFCERAGVAGSVRLSLARKGAADDVSQYLLYNCPLDPNGTAGLNNLSINQGDIIRAYSTNANVSVNVLVNSFQSELF